MTTSGCQSSRVMLPVLAGAGALGVGGNPVGITGPRAMAAVKMLRVSVTDVCNLRCVYCMPEEGVGWLGKAEILSYEEIAAVTRVAASLGVTHVKLTGGEPTARRDLPVLVRMLRGIRVNGGSGGIEDISLTTNGILLEGLLEPLRAAGVDRITVSLDSLDAEKFSKITRGGELARVWRSIERAMAMGFSRIKINTVVIRGMNEDEVGALAALTRDWPLTVRFIEFMPLGKSGLTDDPQRALVTEGEMRARIERECGALEVVERASEVGVGPARVYRLAGAKGRIGFIAAMSAPFCDTCNRLRLTPEGLLRSCLFDGGEIDLKPILRGGEVVDGAGNLVGVDARLRGAFEGCVVMKPETHGERGERAMNRIGG